MQRHHPNRRQSCHQLDNQYQQYLQPRQRSRHHRHGRAGHNHQPTRRRRDAAGKRSTTGIARGNPDQGSKTNTSQHLTSTHAEQSLKASDSPLESRNGITLAFHTKTSMRHQLRRVICYASAMLKGQYNHRTSLTLTRTTETLSNLNRGYMNHQDAEAYGDQGHTPWRKSYTNMIPKTRGNVVKPVHQMITITKTTRTQPTNTYVT